MKSQDQSQEKLLAPSVYKLFIMKIGLTDVIQIQENIKITTELSSIIYLNEFLKYKGAYERDGKNEKLIFTLIFLQIYIECFLHQNMRQIMGMEFEFKNPDLFKKWDSKEEEMYVGEKVNFFTHFFFSKEEKVESLDLIKNSLREIGYIRNKIVHGYKLRRVVVNGTTEKSETLSLLSKESLREYLQSANTLGNAWNTLLDEVGKKCKALRGVGSFKFELFKIDR